VSDLEKALFILRKKGWINISINGTVLTIKSNKHQPAVKVLARGSFTQIQYGRSTGNPMKERAMPLGSSIILDEISFKNGMVCLTGGTTKKTYVSAESFLVALQSLPDISFEAAAEASLKKIKGLKSPTFIPLARGRFRCKQTREITKNPKKYRRMYPNV